MLIVCSEWTRQLDAGDGLQRLPAACRPQSRPPRAEPASPAKRCYSCDPYRDSRAVSRLPARPRVFAPRVLETHRLIHLSSTIESSQIKSRVPRGRATFVIKSSERVRSRNRRAKVCTCVFTRKVDKANNTFHSSVALRRNHRSCESLEALRLISSISFPRATTLLFLMYSF